jgi:hypothetical protein
MESSSPLVMKTFLHVVKRTEWWKFLEYLESSRNLELSEFGISEHLA